MQGSTQAECETLSSDFFSFVLLSLIKNGASCFYNVMFAEPANGFLTAGAL